MAEKIWLSVGFLGQAMFSGRFLVQWISSELRRRSVMPIAFWYFSIAGGVLLLSYAIYRLDPVFILGQCFGLIVYLRNLALIYVERRAQVAGGGEAGENGASASGGSPPAAGSDDGPPLPPA